MSRNLNYLEINREAWNAKVEPHLKSEFYDLEGFLAGKTSLQEIETVLLGSVKGKKILHLQCHFGQDSISLSRMGAEVTAVDLSDKAIEAARMLAEQTGEEVRFICSNVYDLPGILKETFDIVFTSYGVIGWLPDLNKWASLISNFLGEKGRVVFVEFHPVVWMFDDSFNSVAYRYFNSGPIVEYETGTYADRSAAIQQKYVMWNHGLGEVISSLLNNGMELLRFDEYDYSPYNCFQNTIEIEPGKFVIDKLGNKIPMVYSLIARKKV